MKNRICRSIALALCIGALTLAGCENNDKTPTTIPDDETTTAVETTIPAETTVPEADGLLLPDTLPKTMTYSSGVGAWGSRLHLERDGSFKGSYSDSDMGLTGDGYPKGTRHECEFSGKFEIVDQPDAYSYRLKLVALTTEKTPGEEWIEDGTRTIAGDAAGIVDGEDFVLYLPEAPVEGMGEDFLSWWPLYRESEKPETLTCWGLHNVATEEGFFSDVDMNR